MIDAIEYVKDKTKNERQQHLQLAEDCLERGGTSTTCKGVLAQFLNTSIPNGRKGVYLLHACNNAACSNPKHLYWGTPKENTEDAFNCGARVSTGRPKGYTQPEEIKQKISKALKNKPSNNSSGYNGNGTKGLKYKRKNIQVWINNGIIQTRINADTDIPEGYVRGRLK